MRKINLLPWISTFVVCFILIGVPIAGAKNHALLIGIKNYPLIPGRQLEGPVNDVEALKDTLKGSFGFASANITTLINEKASKANILKALSNLAYTTKPNDFIFIFFSGHGTSSWDPGKKNWGMGPFTGGLLPADFSFGKTIEETMERIIVGNRDIRRIIEKIEKDRKIFAIFDACYSGDTVRSIRPVGMLKYVPLARSIDLLVDETPGQHGTETIKEPPYPYKNTIYISASSRREQAWDITKSEIFSGKKTIDGKPHGALTDAILRGLKEDGDLNNNGYITYNELYQFIRAHVISGFPQTPQMLFPEKNRAMINSAVFGGKGKPVATGPESTYKPRRMLRVKLEGIEGNLKSRIKTLKGIETVNSNYDILIKKVKRAYRLYLGNGSLVSDIPQAKTTRVISELKNRIRINDLVAFSYPNQQFNVFVEILGPPGVLIEGDPVGFSIRAEADSYILMLNIDAAGFVNILYPNSLNEISALNAGQALQLPDLGEVVPPNFGIEYIKVFAFKKKPEGMERLLGKEFGPSDYLFNELMNLAISAGNNTAQETLQVITCKRKELLRGF